MHRSRFSTLLFDVPAAEAPAAATFWSSALGLPARPVPDEPQFTHLDDPDGTLPALSLAVQAIDDQARYHLDIETDDVDAETARLLGLGAVEVGRWLGCRTLRARRAAAVRDPAAQRPRGLRALLPRPGLNRRPPRGRPGDWWPSTTPATRPPSRWTAGSASSTRPPNLR
ncbi:VOC family protein [Micromonosporaceae bacterium Da 78-11]